MALVLKNRVKVTTTTTGTGTITLGSAVAGYQDFTNIGNANQVYYVIAGGTEWETGKGTYTSSGTTLSRDVVFQSSNSGALVNFSAGSKEVFVSNTSVQASIGMPYCDDSEIGTDLSGWKTFQAALQAGVDGGQTFGNNNTNGIVSTYSLVYTNPGAYLGGVLAPNGDIHFISGVSARVGQKVSAAGVVSTYSLVYTTSNAYVGGVLAQDGSITFIPNNANRGQRISTCPAVPLPTDACISSFLNKF